MKQGIEAMSENLMTPTLKIKREYPKKITSSVSLFLSWLGLAF